DNFFATVDKLLIADNKVFILDKYQALTLFVYNLEGEFIYKIDNYGRGPGEYEAPSDFAIDNQRKRIILYDLAGIKLVEYNINDGSFIEEKRLDFIPSTFTKTTTGYTFFNNNSVDGKSEYNVIITDNNLKVVNRYNEINPN